MPAFEDTFLTAAEAAAMLRVSRPSFWSAVARGDLPRPFYVRPRAPRWSRRELLDAVSARRALPREAVARRRAARAAAAE